jgi:hypothetical protein
MKVLNCYNDAEAAQFRDAETDLRARSAMLGMHCAYLECVGFQPCQILTERRNPIFPLDWLLFNQAVAQTFRNWSGEPVELPVARDSDEHLVGVPEAIDYVRGVHYQLGRIGLLRFISTLQSMDISGCKVDVQFCCWFLSQSVFTDRNNYLQVVLKGLVAKDSDRMSTDIDYWFARFSGEPPCRD